MSFGRRKRSDGRVDTVPDFMRFAVMWHAGWAAGAPQAKLSGRLQSGENKWIGV